jgi:oxazoline/thiazoline synthase
VEVLVPDQSRTDVGMPVVKVIVPGLRLFRARFGPGWLYGVPARMGWLQEAFAEEELNPAPVLF